MENFRDVSTTIANKEISREMAVTLYGTEKQQVHFKKYNKFTNKNMEDALLKTLLQHFDSVEKVGRPVHYKIGNILEEVRARVDKRGGNNESPHTKYLDAIVLMALSSKMFDEHETTMDKWVYNFGLVNEILYKLKTAPYSSPSSHFKQRIKQTKVIHNSEGSVEINFFLKDYNSHKATLENTLIKMDKDNLINFYKVPKVKLKRATTIEESGIEEDFITEVITVPSSTEKVITEKLAELREKHDITFFEIMNPSRTSEHKRDRVESYEKEKETFFKEEGHNLVGGEIESFWFNRAISVKATETKIKKYLKTRRPEFYELYIEDKELFLSNSQENYEVERNNKLLRDAYKEIDSSLHKFIEDYKDISPISRNRNKYSEKEIQRIENFWRNNCAENVKNLLPELSPDKNIGAKY